KPGWPSGRDRRQPAEPAPQAETPAELATKRAPLARAGWLRFPGRIACGAELARVGGGRRPGYDLEPPLELEQGGSAARRRAQPREGRRELSELGVEEPVRVERAAADCAQAERDGEAEHRQQRRPDRRRPRGKGRRGRPRRGASAEGELAARLSG